jgi:hypothetical protein
MFNSRFLVQTSAHTAGQRRFCAPADSVRHSLTYGYWSLFSLATPLEVEIWYMDDAKSPVLLQMGQMPAIR